MIQIIFQFIKYSVWSCCLVWLLVGYMTFKPSPPLPLSTPPVENKTFYSFEEMQEWVNTKISDDGEHMKIYSYMAHNEKKLFSEYTKHRIHAIQSITYNPPEKGSFANFVDRTILTEQAKAVYW